MLEELKQALSDIGYEATDALASLALSLTTEKILNYCNLEELPEALHYTALEMALECVAALQGEPSALREGDCEMTLEGTGDDVLRDHAQLLNRFRRVV